MPTNNYVESSFWNFDALFQPQQHPARDEHDTFFISDPARASIPDPEYMKRVREVHELAVSDHAGIGIIGLRRRRGRIFSEHILRLSLVGCCTSWHKRRSSQRKSTSLSIGFSGMKLLMRLIWRSSTKIEGLVADRNLSLGHLKGIIHEFFKRMGMNQLRFKPTHNPYTTPSLEIHSYHEGLGKWVEVGNSGVFRPEMIRPMGIPEDVTVIAWGLSLERPTMIRYGIKNIRDLFGHKVDLDVIQSNPLCRLTF